MVCMGAVTDRAESVEGGMARCRREVSVAGAADGSSVEWIQAQSGSKHLGSSEERGRGGRFKSRSINTAIDRQLSFVAGLR